MVGPTNIGVEAPRHGSTTSSNPPSFGDGHAEQNSVDTAGRVRQHDGRSSRAVEGRARRRRGNQWILHVGANARAMRGVPGANALTQPNRTTWPHRHVHGSDCSTSPSERHCRRRADVVRRLLADVPIVNVTCAPVSAHGNPTATPPERTRNDQSRLGLRNPPDSRRRCT
jgi:hypothetical protein